MKQPEIIKEVLSKTTNRRGLLKKLAFAGAAVTATTQAQTPAGPAPADVVQFALNLEYLEAEFYSVATTGLTLQQRNVVALTGSGTFGPTTSASLGIAAGVTQTGTGVNFGVNTAGGFGSARAIAADELNHVILLRAALTANGVMPIAKPAINLDALAGLGLTLTNQYGFLNMARIFEDIGVSAYAGGAGFLVGSPYLGTAARILAVEGEHVGNIRLQLSLAGLTAPILDGADVTPPPAQSLYYTAYYPTNSVMSFFSTNPATGLCAVRTPGQVLYLAYGNQANVTSGGFFPAGMNGVLNTSSAAATGSGLN